MFFIQNLAIGNLVIILTTWIDLNSIDIIPAIVSGLSSFIENIFTHIVDYCTLRINFYWRGRELKNVPKILYIFLLWVHIKLHLKGA